LADAVDAECKVPYRNHDIIRLPLGAVDAECKVPCRNHDIIRLPLGTDTDDRKVMTWVGTSGGGLSGEMIRDMLQPHISAACSTPTSRQAVGARPALCPRSIVLLILAGATAVELDVVLDADARDQLELGLDEIDVVLLVA
jgi:hypothetical protein